LLLDSQYWLLKVTFSAGGSAGEAGRGPAQFSRTHA
jgi:hypothetical protein